MGGWSQLEGTACEWGPTLHKAVRRCLLERTCKSDRKSREELSNYQRYWSHPDNAFTVLWKPVLPQTDNLIGTMLDIRITSYFSNFVSGIKYQIFLWTCVNPCVRLPHTSAPPVLGSVWVLATCTQWIPALCLLCWAFLLTLPQTRPGTPMLNQWPLLWSNQLHLAVTSSIRCPQSPYFAPMSLAPASWAAGQTRGTTQHRDFTPGSAFRTAQTLTLPS